MKLITGEDNYLKKHRLCPAQFMKALEMPPDSVSPKMSLVRNDWNSAYGDLTAL